MVLTPRLVATDLDGTLLGPDGTVSDRTRSVLAALDALGVPVVFVTGRPIRWMESLWEEVGGHGIAVCSNGGIVYDVSSHSVTLAHPIDREVALEVADRLRSLLPGTTFALEKTTGFGREPSFRPRVETPSWVQVAPLPQLLDDTVVKLLARHEDHPPEHYWDQVEGAVGDLVTTTWSSVGTLVEMSALGVTKASALAGLCADLGVDPSEVVAFGDMPNDVPMLTWAGTSYAMGAAHPLARAAADRVAPGNDQDGVAVVLSELFGLRDSSPPHR